MSGDEDGRAVDRPTRAREPSNSECTVVGILNCGTGALAVFWILGRSFFRAPSNVDLAAAAAAVLLVSAWSAWKSPATSGLAICAVTAPIVAFAALASVDVIAQGDWAPLRHRGAIAFAAGVVPTAAHAAGRALRAA